MSAPKRLERQGQASFTASPVAREVRPGAVKCQKKARNLRFRPHGSVPPHGPAQTIARAGSARRASASGDMAAYGVPPALGVAPEMMEEISTGVRPTIDARRVRSQ